MLMILPALFIYLLVEFTENALYRDMYRYMDMNRDMRFRPCRPARVRLSIFVFLLDTKQISEILNEC